ncbi:pantoate--beta-alanine ligase [Corynebacterium mendelii]|uniref:pantoate--beta-alanine ligase (AMP-forming) n=1 Tax=Corynebacterium mendelii TaxID=2765362 RepID=A0A939E3P7_9CORY|nr:pantoate--beta-alanine ligase [Corynebacterium mendelii]MBN9645106.1 pantoate--beta-alanine ligase [Corynebacterium mendelii]
MAQTTRALRKTGRPVVLVPVQLPLHEAHIELICAARSLPRAVVVAAVIDEQTLMGNGADKMTVAVIADQDRARLEQAGCELVYVPSMDELFPSGFRTTVTAGELGACLEGAVQPGYFDKYLTAVAKLINQSHCSDVVIGEKKYQHLLLVQQMVTDLSWEITVHSVPVIRRRDGVAVSRAEKQLSPEQRETAIALSAALTAGAHAGPQGPEKVKETAQMVLESVPGIDIDYLEITDCWLNPITAVTGDHTEARLIAAVRIGDTRLVDNVGVICEDLTARQEKEIVQAALNAAGLDSELSEQEYRELKSLKRKVDEIRSARHHRDSDTDNR